MRFRYLAAGSVAAMLLVVAGCGSARTTSDERGTTPNEIPGSSEDALVGETTNEFRSLDHLAGVSQLIARGTVLDDKTRRGDVAFGEGEDRKVSFSREFYAVRVTEVLDGDSSLVGEKILVGVSIEGPQPTGTPLEPGTNLLFFLGSAGDRPGITANEPLFVPVGGDVGVLDELPAGRYKPRSGLDYFAGDGFTTQQIRDAIEKGREVKAAVQSGKPLENLPAPTVRDLTAERASGLKDFDGVVLSAGGFPAEQVINVAMCAAEAVQAVSATLCDPTTAQATTSNAAGEIELEYTARKIIKVNGVEINCGERPGRCVIGAAPVSDMAQAAAVAVAFG